MLGCRTAVVSGGRAAPHHARRPAATAAAALAALCLAAAAAPPAAAQDAAAEAAAVAPAGNPFVQRGVPAEATAENGVLARERALAAGRRAAWGRLTAEAGLPGGVALGDGQIEGLVDSIVIEQERVAPTRYSARITVNFNPGRVRSVLGSRAPGGAPARPAEAAPEGTAAAPRPGGPASNWVEAVATYRSMEEWLELQRRLRGAGAVASVEVQGVAVDRARIRLGLRAPPPVASGDLAGLGVALEPTGTAAAPGAAGEIWRVGLAGGG
jgi:hypothetical protein